MTKWVSLQWNAALAKVLNISDTDSPTSIGENRPEEGETAILWKACPPCCSADGESRNHCEESSAEVLTNTYYIIYFLLFIFFIHRKWMKRGYDHAKRGIKSLVHENNIQYWTLTVNCCYTLNKYFCSKFLLVTPLFFSLFFVQLTLGLQYHYQTAVSREQFIWKL